MRFGKIESTIVTLCSDIFKHAFVRRCSPSTTQEKSEPLSVGKKVRIFHLLHFLQRHFHFQSQQRGLFVDAACISGQAAVCSDNAVAGNDDRDHIVSDSPAHSLRRHPGKAALCGQLPCQCTIGRGLAAGDAAQQRPHLLLKGRASGMKRRGEVRLLPSEINIQPPSGLGEHSGLLLLMYCIQGTGKVLLPLEPEAGQADVISGQQDAAQRRLIVLCIDHRLPDLNAQLELQVAPVSYTHLTLPTIA